MTMKDRHLEPLWLHLSPGLTPYLRSGDSGLTRAADGSLLVAGEPVIQQAEFPGGLIALVTMTGVALILRDELERRPLAVA